MTTTHIAPNATVSYEDMANPRRVGTIKEVRISRFCTEYLVAWEDGTESQSTCRGAGWKVAA